MNTANAQQLDDLTQRIAYKIGKDYGLGERDFVIRFYPTKRFEYVIKAGGVIRVYFSHTPKYVDYEVMMRRCLKQVAIVKKSKKVGIIVYGSDKEVIEQMHKDNPGWETLPELLPFDELLFDNLYKVVMTHRKTGLTVIKEGKIGKYGKTIPRLMIDARLELSDLVAALNNAHSQLEQEKVSEIVETENENTQHK